MASAAITVVENPATLESDTSEAVITNGSSSVQSQRFFGELRNHGPADVWCKISVDPRTAAASVVTTGAQAQLQVPLAAGDSLPVMKWYHTIAHKTDGATAVLSWVPVRNGG